VSQLLGTSVEDLVQTMKDRKVRIPSEIGAFIALETCEALMEGPARARTKDVRIADDGTISIYAPPNSATSEEAARSVVTLLSSLLLASGTGVPKALVTLLEKGPSSARWDLASLKNDLDASLVPLNRAAARRVLSRLLREAKRPQSGRPAPAAAPVVVAPPEDTLDAELDALIEPSIPKAAPVPREVERLASSSELDAELDATISELDAPPQRPPEPRQPEPKPADESTLRDAPAPSPIQRPVLRDEPQQPIRKVRSELPTEPPPQRRSATESGLIEAPSDLPTGKRSVLPWVLAFVAVVAATAAGVALMRPDLIDRALGRPAEPEEDPGPTAEDRERMMREHRARFGTLTVRATPDRAQILLFVGRGPALAEELPVGVAHEFVVIEDGHAPTRSVLPVGAEWETVDGAPRYELAMQTGAPLDAGLIELGPTQLPRDVGSPGALGSVRVVTNPPGAKVYLLVGFSPEAVVENVRTDTAVELLVYLEGHPISRLVVGPSDWQQAADGTKTAEVSTAIEGAEEEDE
jgi:hypothetical protein